MDIKIYKFSEIIIAGETNPHVSLTRPTPDSVYMFCYTSGTTGDPKGAKILHRSMLYGPYAANYFKFGL